MAVVSNSSPSKGTFMSLTGELTNYIRAAFSGIYIQSQEPQEAIAEIAQLCRNESWKCLTWDVLNGVNGTAAGDPLAAVKMLSQLEGPALLILRGFHKYLTGPEVIAAIEQELLLAKTRQCSLIIIAPSVQLPLELERLFVVIDHELPSREVLNAIAAQVGSQEGEYPEGTARETILDASVGMTRYEAEGAYSLSIIEHGRIEPQTLWNLKSQSLAKQGYLSLHRGGETFEQLGGLMALKAFCKRSLLRSSRENTRRRAKGVLLLGVPGVGKSAFAKSLGAETGRPTLLLDIGALLGSLVGQTEQNIRQALKLADAMAPCLLYVDEIEKALSGASGQGDSGVSTRLLGTFLTWLNDHESDVYVVATCNDISKLPPEFSRAERWDATFFLDLPDDTERQAIWKIFLKSYELDEKQKRPSDAQWTGAEIKACCRLAALLDLPLLQAAQNVVPLAVTASESIERLRNWASGRCLSAREAGIYQRESPASRRKIQGDPLNN
jgi:hypothetical protein